jgi:hypothetical protein
MEGLEWWIFGIILCLCIMQLQICLVQKVTHGVEQRRQMKTKMRRERADDFMDGF